MLRVNKDKIISHDIITKWKRLSVHAPPASDVSQSFHPKIRYVTSYCDVS